MTTKKPNPHDPARIDRVLTAIKAVWERYPQQRLGQLICNATAISDRDVFYMDDERLVWFLWNYSINNPPPVDERS